MKVPTTRIILALALVAGAAAPRAAQAEDEALAAGGEAFAATGGEGKAPYDFISDGKRVEVKGKGLSMVPPVGWEVFTSHPNLTLLMQVPYDKSLKYQRTIQVASFSGPRYMDEVTAKEFESLIVRKFSQISSSIEGYRIRNRLPIEMADGRTGMLFYSEFKMFEMDLMQAHVLIASPQRHYLMSFTDVADHFEKDDQNQFLTEAWEALTSAQLEGRSPARFESMVAIGIGAGVLAVLGVLVWMLRTWRAGRQYRQFESGRGLDEVDSADSQVPTSLVPMTGEEEALRSKKKKKARAERDEDEVMESSPAPSRAPVRSQSKPTALPTSAPAVSTGMSKVPSTQTPSTQVPAPPSAPGLSKFDDDDDDLAV